MNKNYLENLRKKYLAKFWFFILLPTLLIPILLFVFIFYYSYLESMLKLISTVFIVGIVYLYITAGSVAKEYENMIKKHLIKIALKRIPDLDINWETFGYNTAIDLGSKEQQKWNEKFDKERKEFESKLFKIHNNGLKIFNTMLPKTIKGKKQEDLTDEEKKKLEEIDLKLKKILDERKILEKEQYEKDCNELEKLNSFALTANKQSKRDYYKIKYLKEKIKEYKEQVKIEKFADELRDLKVKNNAGTITVTEKERITYLTKILEDHNKKISKQKEEVDNECQRLILIHRVINDSIIEDDKFFGIYKGKKFIFVEAHDEGKSPIFNGTILQIELNNEINNRILVLKKMIFSSETWYKTVKKDLKKLKVKLPFYTDYEIYAKSPNNVNTVLNNDFINFVNNITNDYSYVIEDKNLYVIIPHKADKYKFGNLFKKVYDENQYKPFYNDMNKILRIIEYVAKYAF